MEYSATDGASMLYPLSTRLTDHCGREGTKTLKSQAGEEQRETVSSRHDRTRARMSSQHLWFLQKSKPVIPSTEDEPGSPTPHGRATNTWLLLERVYFSLRVWPLVGWSHFSGWPQTCEYKVAQS